MAAINLHAEAKASVTCVSNIFIDHYMNGLGGDDVKVYLRLLRCLYDSEADFDVCATATALGIPARTVRTALDALSASGILSLDYDDQGDLCDICLRPLTAQMTEEDNGQMSFSFAGAEDQKAPTGAELAATDQEADGLGAAEPSGRSKRQASSAAPAQEASMSIQGSTPSPSASSAADFESDPEIRQILFITERYLGRALNNSGMETIISWHVDFGMDEDLIDYLITSTLDPGTRPLNGVIDYMDAIARDWYKRGIRTVEEAKLDRKQHSENILTIKKAFGLSSQFTQAQMEYADRWFGEWHFSREMVLEACNRTMTNIGSPRFGYADTILEAWHRKGYTEVSQVSEDDKKHQGEIRSLHQSRSHSSSTPVKKNSFNFYSEKNNYDSKAIEAMLLQNNTF